MSVLLAQDQGGGEPKVPCLQTNLHRRGCQVPPGAGEDRDAREEEEG